LFPCQRKFLPWSALEEKTFYFLQMALRGKKAVQRRDGGIAGRRKMIREWPLVGDYVQIFASEINISWLFFGTAIAAKKCQSEYRTQPTHLPLVK